MVPMRPIIALLAALALPAAPAMAQDVPFTPAPSLWRETVGTVPADLRGILRAPVDHPRAMGRTLATVGVLVLLDKPLTDFYQDTIERAFRNFALPKAPVTWPEAGLVSEDIWLFTGIAGSFVYGKLAGDDRAARAAALSTKGLAYAVLTSQYILKPVLGRKRPWPDLDNPQGDPNQYTDDPLDFFDYDGAFLSPGRPGRSMPSYHFTEYMTVARIYSGLYDNSPVPYGIAAVLAVSDIEGHHHWVSDMVAGGMIGYGLGSLILQNDAAARGLTTMPVLGQDTAGLALNLTF